MNIMKHHPMSDLTTPRELVDANLDDQEKLGLGLESRTLCCLSVVPTDCLNAICSHGIHHDREDGPCTEYQPSDILSHPNCPNVRSPNMARWETLEAWDEAQGVRTA